MNNFFSDTINAAIELKESFKCLFCKNIPNEPYYTGVCDHLLCKECISKSNLCPICQAQFFQKELHLNKMIKEAILYVNQIIEFTSTDKEHLDQNPSLSDLTQNLNNNNEKKENLETNPKKTLNNKKSSEIEFKTPMFPIMPPPQIQEPMNSQTKSRSRNRNLSSQKPNRSQSTVNKNKKQTQNDEQFEESQKPRTQSTSGRRIRKNDKGETPLHIAVMNGDIEKLKELLNDPLIDVNAKDFAGWSSLHEAVNKNNIEMLKILVEHNADINALGYQKNTPLHEAALNKRYESAKFLLECGANQNIRNEFGVLAKDFVLDCPDFIELFDKNLNNLIESRDSNYLSLLSQSPKISNNNQEDLNISCTFNQRKTKNKPQKKIILFGTGMKEEEKAKLNDLASKLNLQVAKEMNNNVTHVIYTTNKICSRTINYMKAILMGIWIVNLKWLENSALKGSLIEEIDYEAKGSVKLPNSNGPFKGRVNASSQYPKLFEDCKFYFYGDFSVFDKQDLIKLAQLAGATILKREPKLERVDELMTSEIPHHLDIEYDKNFCCSHFILYDTSKLKEDIKHKYLYSVRPSWLFACIDQFKILHPDTIAK